MDVKSIKDYNEKLFIIKYLFKNRQYKLKDKYNSIIPLHIYQSYFTKNLPIKMNECVNKLKTDNPEFIHHLYDDEDCLVFVAIICGILPVNML
jgi:mannosyltransferase OCH1-like enzyme